MNQIYVSIIDFNAFVEKTGKQPKSKIVKLDKKIAEILIKKGVVELSDIQRDLEESKEEKIPIDKSPEVMAFLQRPDLLQALIKKIQENVVGEEKTILTLILVCCSGKTINKSSSSANLCASAFSGSGKDWVVSQTLRLFPKKILFCRRRISPKALDYALAKNKNRNWDNYIIYLEDVANNILNSDSVKTLFTAKASEWNETEIAIEGEAKLLSIFGKPVFILTAAKANSADETIRRVPFVSLDETKQQTSAITKKQAFDAEQGKVPETDGAFFEKRFFLGLEPVIVIIPFASTIQEKLAEQWIACAGEWHTIQRTIFQRFLDYIKFSAALHQHQRKKSENGFVIAEPEDYENARIALMQSTQNKLMIPLNREQRDLLGVLMNSFQNGGTVTEIGVKFNKWSDRWLRNGLDRLADLGFVKTDSTFLERADKPSKTYIPVKGIIGFEIPTAQELNLQNSSIASFTSIASSVHLLHLPPEKKQLKQLNSEVKHENEEILQICSICDLEKPNCKEYAGKLICSDCHIEGDGIQ